MTTAAQSVDFFYGIGSRYSYLASTQLDRLAAETGCRIRWRPLSSGDLFAARGLDPFAGRPVSGQYDWTYRRFDAQCWADYYGVPFREPEDIRFDPRRLALACTAAARLGAVERFSRRLFGALFVDGTSPLDDAACAALAAGVGLDPAAFRRALDEPMTRQALARTLQDALRRGVFGVPGFVLAGRVYFGNDRLPILRHVLLEDRRGRL
ncbi:MAG: 2-hydroxychromene-2-carboxylate isomerase [Geminicoccales bacterium]